VIDLIHLETMLKADVYLAGSDPLHRRAFQHILRVLDSHLRVKVGENRPSRLSRSSAVTTAVAGLGAGHAAE
jgi:hypothetical protein